MSALFSVLNTFLKYGKRKSQSSLDIVRHPRDRGKLRFIKNYILSKILVLSLMGSAGIGEKYYFVLSRERRPTIVIRYNETQRYVQRFKNLQFKSFWFNTKKKKKKEKKY